ncbi:hypothetical protein [Candidatus Nitrospira bockiana]
MRPEPIEDPDHRMYPLEQFGLKEMTECGAAIRRLGSEATSFDDVAGRIVRYLRDHLLDAAGRPACLLVRFFKTHRYDRISPALQQFASRKVNGTPIEPHRKCFVLMASAGQQPEWNSREHSARFKAIPIVGDQFVAQFPMFSQLLTQFGVDVGAWFQPGSELLVDRNETAFNVFHVAEASDSPYIPLQEEFVVPYGVRSVLGFGSLLPSGEIFAVILFARVTVSREVADLFKTIALCSKIALLPFEGEATYIS